MSAPSVVVVILTFNSAQNISDCIDSLLASTYPCQEIVIVDNGSTDGTLDIVKAHYPNVKCIDNDKNLGYAEGNNVGLCYALDRDAFFALVLNDDVVVDRDMLAQLVNVAQAQPDAALLGPIVYHHTSPGVIQSAGGEQTAQWKFIHRGQNQPDDGQFREVESVAWLTGCAILARCSAIRKSGLFDSDYFMYWEDVDWCLRVRRAGYKVLFVPCAKLWHKGVQIDYKPSVRVAYYSTRNEFLLLRRHHAGWRANVRAILQHTRTIISYTVRPRWRDRRLYRDAHVRALCDFALGRFGPAQVA